jgi:hypothetical protein
MTDEIMMRKTGPSKLEIIDPVSAEAFEHVPCNKDLFVVVRSRRNPKQHRLAWALASKLVDGCDFLHDSEEAMTYLKYKTKHVKVVMDQKTGKSFVMPKSISFASMTQEQFSRFLNRAIYVVCSEIIPGLPEKTLRAELLAMVGGK